MNELTDEQIRHLEWYFHACLIDMVHPNEVNSPFEMDSRLLAANPSKWFEAYGEQMVTKVAEILGLEKPVFKYGDGRTREIADVYTQAENVKRLASKGRTE